MLYAVLGLVVIGSIGLALYALINKGELEAQVAALQQQVLELDSDYTAEVEGLRSELVKLEKLKHVPGIIERAKKLDAAIAAKLEQAQRDADEAVLVAHKDVERMRGRIAAKAEESRQRGEELVKSATREAEALKQRIIGDIAGDADKAKEARRLAEWQAGNVLEQAQQQAKEIMSRARKEAKEKTKKVDEVLNVASTYALEIRERAEARAQEIGGKAYEASKRYEFYRASYEAMQNAMGDYLNTYAVPASHILDDLADEFGFHKAGERLRVARDRTRIMQKEGKAATCNFPEGWKREYAINFVLGAFNGRVDSILARLKPANQGKLIQEIKDVYALANHNGQVFKNARIQEEFLESRLEELKWAVAAQRVKEKAREEQRAIRERIREEEKARKEYERAIKQAEHDEAILAKALEQARKEHADASAEERGAYEEKMRDLAEKLLVAEEKGRRAVSMAQQTKKGCVYVISNIGSFGEDVYKIGLTRRLEPLDRVRELGGASVPFPFDVHAMITAEDAPALEAALHRRFLQHQVNKVNRRKEFFRLKLQDLRGVADEMKLEVRWTMAADAVDYRETMAMENQMQEDPEFRRRWAESEAAFEARRPFEDEVDETEQVEEETAVAEEVG